jgi:hypothetical protein
LLWWFPAAPDCGIFQLGWRGVLCLLPLAVLGFPVVKSITKPHAAQ